jgi:hypothetical protein
LNESNGDIADFLSLKNSDPAFRPVDVECDPDGNALYVTSFAESEHVDVIPGTNVSLPSSRIWVYPNNCVIWKISGINTTSDVGNIDSNKVHLAKEFAICTVTIFQRHERLAICFRFRIVQ